MERPNKATHLPAEFREYVLADAKPRILAGDSLDAIAASHNISRRALCYWLSALGDEYKELRQAWLDNMLADALAAIEDESGDVLHLARARDRWKAATWYAERRDRQRYGQSQTITHEGTVTVDVRNLLEERLAKLDQAIAGQCVRLPDPAEPTQDDE